MPSPSQSQLLFAVEHFLRTKAIAPTRLGRDAVSDPRFVFDLRNGRSPRQATSARVLAHMKAQGIAYDLEWLA